MRLTDFLCLDQWSLSCSANHVKTNTVQFSAHGLVRPTVLNEIAPTVTYCRMTGPTQSTCGVRAVCFSVKQLFREFALKKEQSIVRTKLKKPISVFCELNGQGSTPIRQKSPNYHCNISSSWYCCCCKRE